MVSCKPLLSPTPNHLPYALLRCFVTRGVDSRQYLEVFLLLPNVETALLRIGKQMGGIVQQLINELGPSTS